MDVVNAVKAVAPEVYVAEPLYDYYLKQNDAESASRYSIPSTGVETDDSEDSEDKNIHMSIQRMQKQKKQLITDEASN